MLRRCGFSCSGATATAVGDHLKTPQRAPMHLQREAFVLAVAMILARYRTQSPEWIRDQPWAFAAQSQKDVHRVFGCIEGIYRAPSRDKDKPA
jgi:hypothetical protein